MPSADSERRELFWIVWGVGLLLAALVRVACATGDLWLDEIWTIDLIRRSGSPGDVLSVHNNNNHPLNTWLLYAIGDQGRSFLLYRVHSIVAGVGTVVVAGLIALRRGRLESALAVVLTASSYLLIHFSTEARGYSMVVFFSLTAFYALSSFVTSRSVWTAAAFWICCILGLLSHLFFVQFYMAAGLWSFATMALHSPWRVALRDTAIAHAPVFAFVGLLAFTFLSEELQGSAVPTGPLLWSVFQAVSLGLGGPGGGSTTAVVSVLAAGVLGWGLWLLRRDRDQLWLFYALVCFCVPAALLWWDSPYAIFARYFLITISFLLLLLAFVLADLARRGSDGRKLAALVLALVCFGNVVNIIPLWRNGHGQYLAALQYMIEHSPGRAITVGSDHRFRNASLVEFYAPMLERRIHYIDAGNGHPEWLIVHYPGSKPGRGAEAVLYEGREYELQEIFRTSDLAGFDWRIYHRGLTVSAAAPSDPASE